MKLKIYTLSISILVIFEYLWFYLYINNFTISILKTEYTKSLIEELINIIKNMELTFIFSKNYEFKITNELDTLILDSIFNAIVLQSISYPKKNKIFNEKVDLLNI